MDMFSLEEGSEDFVILFQVPYLLYSNKGHH